MLYRRIIHSWQAGLAVQAAIMVVFSAIGALLPLAASGAGAYTALKAVFQWTALPVMSGITAFLPACGGLTMYLCWLLPPVIVSALPWLIVGYPLAPGIMLLCAFTAMIGAATGAVARGRREDNKSDR